jgi:hypothetical protein
LSVAITFRVIGDQSAALLQHVSVEGGEAFEAAEKAVVQASGPDASTSGDRLVALWAGSGLMGVRDPTLLLLRVHEPTLTLATCLPSIVSFRRALSDDSSPTITLLAWGTGPITVGRGGS